MGGGAAFAGLKQTQSELLFNDNNSFVDMKDKKKKRRSRRMQNTPPQVSCAVSEVSAAEFSAGDSTLNNVGSVDRQLSQVPDVDFSSSPNMHIDEQKSECKDGNGNHRNRLSILAVTSDTNGRACSDCPENIDCEDSVVLDLNGGFVPLNLRNYKSKGKYYPPQCSPSTISRALKEGKVFKALFCVNGYNRLEAYCRIEGLQTDILISGLEAQNRAVDGDCVAIRVDHPSLWIKMKGFDGNFEKSTTVNDFDLHIKAANIVPDSIKGKNKKDVDCNFCGGNRLTLYKNAFCNGEILSPEFVRPLNKDYFEEPWSSSSDYPGACCSTSGDESVNTLAHLSATMSSFPSLRPTGRVIGIIETSPRRNSIVGFLGVKQLVRSREASRLDMKKNKMSLSALNQEYIMLTPIDPKFPKMMVRLRSLPEGLRERLEAGDATVEMDLVGAQIVGWEKGTKVPEALVTHCFGRGGKIEAQVAAILFENAINASQFSVETLSCLPHVAWEVPPEEFEGRKDLRNLCIFTIDPSTATDLDDALSVETLSNGNYRVGVHIADVSFFVLPDTAVDIDAQIRSTAVYTLQQKLPMLPPVLSEDLGSLNHGVDRLTFSIVWHINPDGEVLDRWIGRTVIRSCCKLSYEHAQDIINGLFDAQRPDIVQNDMPKLYGCFEWSNIVKSVKILHEISRSLKARRFADGALSLEGPKVAFLLDEEGIPYDSVMCGRKESNFLVEEFMLLANRTAAEVIARAYPCSALLRRHPEPNLRKLRDFEAFCTRNGWKLDVSSSAQFHHSLELIKLDLENDSVLLDILMSYAARPLQLAAYFCTGDSKVVGGVNWGHYALAVPYYTHFTSPLRRYPDILVHRMLAATVEAEEMYLQHKESMRKLEAKEVKNLRCFTGLDYVKDIVESSEAQEFLSAAASKYKIPGTETVVHVASHCNDRKLATRHVRVAIDKLYTWALLRKKQILCLEARVLGLGPRFMSIYIPKFAVERRIYYDEVDGLFVEWLDATSTLVLSLYTSEHYSKRVFVRKYRRLEEVALIVSPCDSNSSLNASGHSATDETKGDCLSEGSGVSQMADVSPAVFPLTLRLLSTVPVVLHAVGGDDGPIDIGARLYMSSYFKYFKADGHHW